MTSPGAPSTRCMTCTAVIVDTEVGWTHVDTYGQLAGWVCRHPHMTLATPAGPTRRREDEPVRGQQSSPPPGWVEGYQPSAPSR